MLNENNEELMYQLMIKNFILHIISRLKFLSFDCNSDSTIKYEMSINSNFDWNEYEEYYILLINDESEKIKEKYPKTYEKIKYALNNCMNELNEYIKEKKGGNKISKQKYIQIIGVLKELIKTIVELID